MSGPDDDWNDPDSLTSSGSEVSINAKMPGVGMTMFVLVLFALYGVYVGHYQLAMFALGSLAIVAVAVAIAAAWVTAMREFYQ